MAVDRDRRRPVAGGRLQRRQRKELLEVVVLIVVEADRKWVRNLKKNCLTTSGGETTLVSQRQS